MFHRATGGRLALLLLNCDEFPRELTYGRYTAGLHEGVATGTLPWVDGG